MKQTRVRRAHAAVSLTYVVHYCRDPYSTSVTHKLVENRWSPGGLSPCQPYGPGPSSCTSPAGFRPWAGPARSTAARPAGTPASISHAFESVVLVIIDLQVKFLYMIFMGSLQV